MNVDPDKFMAQFSPEIRPIASHLLQVASLSTGGNSPGAALTFIRRDTLARAWSMVQAAALADPRLAFAKIAGINAERQDPEAKKTRQRGYIQTASKLSKPPSEAQLKYLKDLGHPNPGVFKTSAEACTEIQRRVSQQGGRR